MDLNLLFEFEDIAMVANMCHILKMNVYILIVCIVLMVTSLNSCWAWPADSISLFSQV